MIFRKLRNWLLAGLVVLLPVWLTLYMVIWLFTNLNAAVAEPLSRYIQIPLPGFGVLVAIVLTLLAGWLTTHFLGRQLLELGQAIMMRIPVVRALYAAVKQVTDAVLSPRDQAFSQVVLVEYPRLGVYSLGFVAGDLPGSDLVRIWLPPGPSPTAGPVVLISRQDMIVLPMRVEDGLKLIVSAGAITPKDSDIAAVAEAAAELRQRRTLG